MGEALERYMKEQPGVCSGLKFYSGVKAMPPEYLWEPYLRKDNLNLIRGDGGTGKTMFAMAIAAAVTRGTCTENMPGELHCGPGNVLYYGAEDDPGECRYRMDMCGCDANKIASPAGKMPTLADTDTIRAQIHEIEARLVVFDPIQAFLPSGTDMNRANEMRPLLDGLRNLCREENCTAIFVEHLNKAEKMKATYRGIGSVDITNGSRSVLFVNYHPDAPGMRVAMQIKANARHGRPIQFSIDGDGGFSWYGTCDITEEALLGARPKPAAPKPDPILDLVRYFATATPEGWTGTATDMLEQGATIAHGITSARTIGKRLLGLQEQLAREGIACTKRNTNDGRYYTIRQISAAPGA